MRSKGEIRSKEEIVDHVWGRVENRDTNLVEVYVGYLAAADVPERPSLVRTVRGYGYELRDPG